VVVVGPGCRCAGCAVVGWPAGTGLLTAPDIAGVLCAVLDSGGLGLIVDMSGAGFFDAECLGSLVRAARRARGWGSWVRVVVPDPHVRRVVRLVSLDEVMPVHASVAEAVAAAGRERAMGRGKCALSRVLSAGDLCRPCGPNREGQAIGQVRKHAANLR
jgi:anti-sigma B factor antagonist